MNLTHHRQQYSTHHQRENKNSVQYLSTHSYEKQQIKHRTTKERGQKGTCLNISIAYMINIGYKTSFYFSCLPIIFNHILNKMFFVTYAVAGTISNMATSEVLIRRAKDRVLSPSRFFQGSQGDHFLHKLYVVPCYTDHSKPQTFSF